MITVWYTVVHHGQTDGAIGLSGERASGRARVLPHASSQVEGHAVLPHATHSTEATYVRQQQLLLRVACRMKGKRRLLSHPSQPWHGRLRSRVKHYGQANRPTAVAAGGAHEDEKLNLRATVGHSKCREADQCTCVCSQVVRSLPSLQQQRGDGAYIC